jgi:hypothetical protein
MKRTILLGPALLICAAVCSSASPREVQGIIDRDVRWNVDEGPFLVVDDLLVTRRARLVIAPGTQVLIAQRPAASPSVPQFDRLDSSSISIRIEGALVCTGRKDKRITFSPVGGTQRCSWYGLILDKAVGQFTEISFVDIAGAYNGISALDCNAVIRSAVLEFNNVGINCLQGGSIRLFNSVIAHNFTAGIRIQQANPQFFNNIIVYNRNNGVWCDGVSKIDFQYNCVYGNGDGDLLECDPELGLPVKASKKKAASVPVDYGHNIYADPVFAGSISDSMAVERDISLPTDKSRMRDTSIARVLYDSLVDSTAALSRRATSRRYTLSKYSPCSNAGHPGNQFRDTDQSRNDMGIYGGPEFIAIKSRNRGED